MNKLTKTIISCLVLLIATTSTKQLSACTSQAGLMSTDTLHVCAFDAVSSVMLNDASGNPTYTLDANDGINYALHTASDTILGTVISINATGQFVFQLGTMSYGQVYYISPVIGNNIGTFSNPIVDLTDMCLSVGAGTPVIWYEYPTADAGINMDVCGLNVQLDATIPTIGTGQWTAITTSGVNWIGSINSNNPALNIPNFDTNATGCLLNTEYTFRWIVSNGPCLTYDDVVVTFRPEPVANAGENFSVCGFEAITNASFSLCDNTVTGEWSGAATFSHPTHDESLASVNIEGVYTFSWTETNGPCTSTDYVSINFVTMPEPNAGLDNTICGTAYTLSVLSFPADGVWSGPADAIFSDINDPQSEVNIVMPPATYVRLVEFVWTETCGVNTNSDTVEILFSVAPVALAGIDQNICGNTVDMQADILGFEYATGTWHSPYIGINFSNMHDPMSSVQIPNSGQLIDSLQVTVPIYWTMENNNCVDKDSIEITFYALPEADAGTDTIIYNALYHELNASFSLYNTVGLWENVSYPNIPPSLAYPSDPQSQFIADNYGQYIVTWSESNPYNMACYTIDTVNITFINSINGGNEIDVSELMLSQNTPNPFSSFTEISFSLSSPEEVSLVVYDLLGNKLEVLIDNKVTSGQHTITFPAAKLPSGMYYYALETAKQKSVKKMIIID